MVRYDTYDQSLPQSRISHILLEIISFPEYPSNTIVPFLSLEGVIDAGLKADKALTYFTISLFYDWIVQ
jgi:hypothetical protein